MHRVRLSSKGQIVIPKSIRDELGLAPGTVLWARVEGGRIVLEPAREPPAHLFVVAGPGVVEQVLREAKAAGDKVERLLRDIGVGEGSLQVLQRMQVHSSGVDATG
ncbi:MAG: AbrB/MazE/SpoVT family DNA-binding domain-containing protein [Thermofilaceae archaeon]